MTRKILVVDDNSATRRAVRNALVRRGHEVLEAPDAATAREIMRTQHPRVVIQDLMLPDADGFVLVGELRRLAGTADVSILAFSGFIPELFAEHASGAEFDDIISKPIAPQRLVPIVEAHLPALAGTAAISDGFGRGRRLVIADDNPMQLKLSAFRLTRMGFRVQTCNNGREVLAAIRDERPDVVVSDVMMPVLDGFGLAIELRKDPANRTLPLILLTSTYVETSDRDLALRAGASDLVPRTPELVELTDVLHTMLAGPPPRAIELATSSLPALEREYHERVIRQLERHVVLNGDLAKRCAVLESELAVLANISDTVLQTRDLHEALSESLAECFDAGGLADGALYLLDEAGALTIRHIGSGHGYPDDVMRSLFGFPELLDAVIKRGRTLVIPDDDVPSDVASELLGRAGASAMIFVPLGRAERRLGGFLMLARTRELQLDDWRTFASGVAQQVSQVIQLSQAYEARLQAETHAKRHALLLDAVVQNAPDTILQLDLDGRIRFVNRPIREWSSEKVVGRDWFGFLPEPERARVRATFDRAISTALPCEVEETFGLRTFAIRIGPVVEAGSVIGVVVVARATSPTASRQRFSCCSQIAWRLWERLRPESRTRSTTHSPQSSQT